MVAQSERLERLQGGFKNLTGAAVGIAGGVAGIGLIANEAINRTQELAQAQLEGGIRSAEAIQRARRASISIGLEYQIGDEIIKEIGKEGKKKAAEAVVDPGSEQAKRIYQAGLNPTDLLEQANFDPEGYALFVLETLQKVSDSVGPAEAGLLAEVLAGETGGDYAAGLINSGQFQEFVAVYKEAQILTDDQTKAMRALVGEFGNLIYSFSIFIDSVGAGLSTTLIPLLGWFASGVDAISGFLSRHKELTTFLAVAGVLGFFALSAVLGIVSLSLIQVWVQSLFATGGIASTGIAAAIAAGGWWGLATAIWAVLWPIGLVILIIAGLAVGFYVLQSKLGGVGNAFRLVKDIALLTFLAPLLPLSIMLEGVLLLIKLLNKIPGINIGTDGFESVVSSVSGIRAAGRLANFTDNYVSEQDDEEDAGEDGEDGPGPTGRLRRPSRTAIDNSETNSRNQYTFYNENHFESGSGTESEQLTEQFEKDIESTTAGRRFK